MSQQAQSLRDKNVYEIIDTILRFYVNNVHNERLFEFFTKKSKSEKISNHMTVYWDVSRDSTQLVAVKVQEIVSVVLDKYQLLCSLGFRNYENSWEYPKNDSKLIAFIIHLELFNFKPKSKLQIT